MKKSYVMLAAAAVSLFAACQKEDVLIDQTTELQKPIGFGTYTPYMTRGENSSATNTFGLENYHTEFYVWGYKKVGDSFQDVFTGNDASGVGADKSKVTYDGNNTTIFKDYKWSYTPVRYWDRAATYYNFFAVAPATPVSGTWVAATTNKDAVKFSIADYSVDGRSLKQSASILNVDASGNAVFGESNAPKKNYDLMISDDAVNQNTDHANAVITFKFNHILSRLNIGVKKDEIIKDVDVELTELSVINLKNKGSFNEANTVSGLAEGTVGRWTPAALTAQTSVGVKFKNTSSVATPNPTGEGEDKLTSTTYYPTGTTDNNAAAKNEVTTTENFIYQGLVIPQTVAYKPTAINGSELTANSYTDAPYLKIVYTIEGEKFEAFYNLAEIFCNADASYVHPNYGGAFKLAAGGYAYGPDSDNNYHNSDGTLYSGATESDGKTPAWLDGDDATDDVQKVPMKYSDMDAAGVKVCDLSFYEGWMNTLHVTIKPAAILFDATVYEWVEKYDGEVIVQ